MYGECENFAVLSGHTGAVMDLQLSTDGDTIYTASTDKTICLWDTRTGAKIKKLKGIPLSLSHYLAIEPNNNLFQQATPPLSMLFILHEEDLLFSAAPQMTATSKSGIQGKEPRQYH